jgi:vacuolar-type H+-ATPase subunit I/STV1
MMSLMNSAPEVMSVAADLFVRNMDWPGAKEIADRLKRAVPPQLLGDEGDDEEIPPQAMAKMQEMGQQLQALNAHAEQVEQQAQQLAQENEQLKTQQNDKHDENMLKNKELDADIALKMRELQIKEVELEIKREELDIKEAETLIKAHTAAKPEKESLQSTKQ